MTISAKEYQAFQIFLQRACGILLGSGKEYLVASRLNNLLVETGITTLSALMARLESSHAGDLKVRVIDAMTTNETYWFRDLGHFTLLRDTILPDLNKKQGPAIRIWSAACSSGQEPYSISMVVEEHRNGCQMNSGRQVEILATDISTKVMDEARKAIYCGMAIDRGLTSEQRQRYFKPLQDCYEVHPDIRRRVQFRHFNLADSFDNLGRFDVIFCRNVLIYFSNDLKKGIIDRLTKALNPGGYLLLGSTESLNQHTERFQMQVATSSIAYRLKD